MQTPAPNAQWALTKPMMVNAPSAEANVSNALPPLAPSVYPPDSLFSTDGLKARTWMRVLARIAATNASSVRVQHVRIVGADISWTMESASSVQTKTAPIALILSTLA